MPLARVKVFFFGKSRVVYLPPLYKNPTVAPDVAVPKPTTASLAFTPYGIAVPAWNPGGFSWVILNPCPRALDVLSSMRKAATKSRVTNFKSRELCLRQPETFWIFIFSPFARGKRSRVCSLVSSNRVVSAKLVPGNHAEGYVVWVVGYGEVLAVVDLRPIHRGERPGHLLCCQNFESVADGRNKLIQQTDI